MFFNFLSSVVIDETTNQTHSSSYDPIHNLTIAVVIIFILIFLIAIQFIITENKINKLKKKINEQEEKNI